MRSSLFAFTLLSAAATFAAAQTNSSVGPVVNLPHAQMFIVPQNCPAVMTAQQQWSSQTVWTTALEDAHNSQDEFARRSGNAGVHVELNSFGDKSFRQVELAVYFLAPGSRILPVAESVATSDSKKTFNLSAADGAAMKLRGDLLVGPAASLMSVHLLSITYSDGSVWQAKNGARCSVELSRFLLVGSR